MRRAEIWGGFLGVLAEKIKGLSRTLLSPHQPVPHSTGPGLNTWHISHLDVERIICSPPHPLSFDNHMAWGCHGDGEGLKGTWKRMQGQGLGWRLSGAPGRAGAGRGDSFSAASLAQGACSGNFQPLGGADGGLTTSWCLFSQGNSS